MRTFKGIRIKKGVEVIYGKIPLELRLDLKNLSPLGFEWGYNGSGPRQLALAMLSKVVSDLDALVYYESFADEIINNIETNKWEIDEIFVRKWLENKIYIELNPTLTPRFKLFGDDVNSLLMYLDDKKLGNEEDAYNAHIYISKKAISVDCNFSQISHLYLSELPNNIVFNFIELGDEEININDNFTLIEIVRQDDRLNIEIMFILYMGEYSGKYNSKIVVQHFLEELQSVFQYFHVNYNEIDEGSHTISFSMGIIDTINNLQTIINNAVEVVLKTFDKYFNVEEGLFEAKFRFPEEYQSILKPYMLYFEEFLNDLCIETDVSIRREGLDAILSVEPKNKNEALEKIADALKAYLCAPVIADGLSIEETLQMKTALTKLYAQCKHLESQIMYKDISLREQNLQIELKDNVINESKRILIEAGVDPNIITQKNTILLDSLKTITIKDKTSDKKTFFSSLKASIEVPKIFSGSLELKRKEFKKESND